MPFDRAALNRLRPTSWPEPVQRGVAIGLPALVIGTLVWRHGKRQLSALRAVIAAAAGAWLGNRGWTAFQTWRAAAATSSGPVSAAVPSSGPSPSLRKATRLIVHDDPQALIEALTSAVVTPSHDGVIVAGAGARDLRIAVPAELGKVELDPSTGAWCLKGLPTADLGRKHLAVATFTPPSGERQTATFTLYAPRPISIPLELRVLKLTAEKCREQLLDGSGPLGRLRQIETEERRASKWTIHRHLAAQQAERALAETLRALTTLLDAGNYERDATFLSLPIAHSLATALKRTSSLKESDRTVAELLDCFAEGTATLSEVHVEGSIRDLGEHLWLEKASSCFSAAPRRPAGEKHYRDSLEATLAFLGRVGAALPAGSLIGTLIAEEESSIQRDLRDWRMSPSDVHRNAVMAAETAIARVRSAIDARLAA